MPKANPKSKRRLNHIRATRPPLTDLQKLVRDAKAVLSNVSAHADSEVAELRVKLEAALGQFRIQAERFALSLRNGVTNADRAVRTNPYRSVGIAAGTGLVAGYLVSRRRFRRR